MSCTWSLLSLVCLGLMSSSCFNSRATHLKRMLFRFCWDICLTVLSTCDYSKKNLATVNFLTVQTWMKNGYFFTDQQDSLVLLSIPIMAQAERAFLILSLTPATLKGKLGEQGRFLSVEFHWLYGFFVETALVVAQGFQTILMRINDPVNRCLK